MTTDETAWTLNEAFTGANGFGYGFSAAVSHDGLMEVTTWAQVEIDDKLMTKKVEMHLEPKQLQAFIHLIDSMRVVGLERRTIAAGG